MVTVTTECCPTVLAGRPEGSACQADCGPCTVAVMISCRTWGCGCGFARSYALLVHRTCYDWLCCGWCKSPTVSVQSQHFSCCCHCLCRSGCVVPCREWAHACCCFCCSHTHTHTHQRIHMQQHTPYTAPVTDTPHTRLQRIVPSIVQRRGQL